MSDVWEVLSIIAQIFAYIFGVIVIIQLIKLILGGSWKTEDITLALVMAILTFVFGIMGYLIKLNNKVSKVERMIHGHIEWHKGRDSLKKKEIIL